MRQWRLEENNELTDNYQPHPIHCLNCKLRDIQFWVKIYLMYSVVEPVNPFYRPQRSCGKVMFLHLSVILFTGGGCLPHPPGRHPPCPVHAGIHTPFSVHAGIHPPCPVHAGIHTPLPIACWDMVNKRAVRIPLECILVSNKHFEKIPPLTKKAMANYFA